MLSKSSSRGRTFAIIGVLAVSVLAGALLYWLGPREHEAAIERVFKLAFLVSAVSTTVIVLRSSRRGR